jgi:hypothetical protein
MTRKDIVRTGQGSSAYHFQEEPEAFCDSACQFDFWRAALIN